MVIRYRDMDLEQLYDRLDQLEASAEEGEETEIPNWPAYRRTLNLIVRKQVQTAMRAAEAAEKSARAAAMASWASLATALLAFLTLLVRSLGLF
jgi:F0F1-type ATP synthase gamma subunit